MSIALLAAAGTARAQVVVLGSTVQEHAAHAGETYSGTLRLRNQGAGAGEARLYLRDYTFAAGGVTRYAAPGTLPRSSARWIKFSPAQVRIAPGGEAVVGYTVTVPPDAALAGTFWSMLMVEGIAPGSPESAGAGGPARVRMGIQPTIRYGVQIATTVGGGTSRLAFTSARAYAGPRGKMLELDVANIGDVAGRPEIRVELFRADGEKAGTFSSRRGLLYPGTSLRQAFELGSLPAGEYQALVVGDTGGDQVYGAQYKLRL